MAEGDFSVKAIVSAQTTQFEKGIKICQSSVNSLSNSLSSIGDLVKKAFAFTGITIGTKAIVDFGKSCVQSATQAVKQFNILDNTVKATGATAWTSTKELEEMSKQLSDSTNYSVTEVQNMQSVLLGFTNITDGAFEEASNAVLDMATVMGMDLTSAVQTVGKALDDPITGLDSLRRQGFKFTDEQKAQLTELVKNGNQLEAQKIILDSLALSYGGASKAGQDSFAKQRHSVENFMDTFGGKLIPIFQVFSEASAKALNNLTSTIENMDFTPLVNVVTNIQSVFSSVFNNVKNILSEAGNSVKDFISRFNFKPIISIIDTLIGAISGVINKFKEMNSQSSDIFEKIKDALITFSNSELFENIVNFINKIIDGLFFLWNEIQNVSQEIRNIVVNKLVEIWNKIKELFENSQQALANSGQDIASWSDLFYSILNNAFKIVQDFINLVKALIHGDWSVAWEYAKLTVMRIADNILNIFSTIANAFPDLINGILKGWNKLIEQINKVRKFFGQDPLELAEMFESVDLSKKTGLEQKIEQTEKKIQELTGAAADYSIKELNGVSNSFSGFTAHLLGLMSGLTEGVATGVGKQRTYFESTFSTDDANNPFQKYSEWDSKLLAQRLENLNEWSDEAHKINLQLIEEERKKALEADKTGAERLKINKYYDKEIEKENKRHISAIYSQMNNVFNKIFNVMGKISSSIINGIRNILDNISSFSLDDALNEILKFEDAILTFFIETLPKLPNFLKSAFQSLEVLLDNILSPERLGDFGELLIEMFSEGLKKLSSMIEYFAPKLFDFIFSLVGRVLTQLPELLDTILKSISNLILNIVSKLPGILKEFIPILLNSILGMLNQLLIYAPKIISEIIKSIPEIITGVIEGLSNFISNLTSEDINEIINSIIKMVGDIANSLITSMGTIIQKLIPALIKLIGGLIGKIPEIISGLITGVGNFVGDTVKSIVNGNFFENLWGGIKTTATNIFEGVKDVGTNVWNGITGAVSGIGNWFKGIFGFANGTQSAPRGLAIVGEAGPELVRFRGGEQVMNNHNTQKVLANSSGTIVNQSITFNNLQDTSAFEMMQQLRQYNRQMAINGII